MTEEALRFKIFNNINEDLENLWQEFENNNIHHFFQKIQYIKYQMNKKNNQYFFVIIYFKEKIIAILPLEIENKFSIRILQWIGTSESDYCGAIFQNFENIGIDKKIFLNLWKKILDNIKTYDLILLNKQCSRIGEIINPFAQHLNSIKISKIFLIKLPEEENDYFQNIENKKFINEYHRTEKKLFKDNTVEFKHYEILDNKIKPSDIIKKKSEILHEQKIKNFLNKDMMDFFDNFQKKYPNLLKVSVIEINREIIAANLGIIYNHRFYYFMPVLFSNKYNKFSPGKVLIKFLIKWNISKKIKIFDFGLGDENYKKYWSNYTGNLLIHLDFKSIKGFISYLLIRFYLFFKVKKL